MELGQPTETARFAEMALPHLDAAYNLARWLTRDPGDAADVVQEAMLRALKFFGGFRGGKDRVEQRERTARREDDARTANDSYRTGFHGYGIGAPRGVVRSAHDDPARWRRLGE